ncbi:WD40/YVTN/BNR-like repeat-containing protein [Variovorax paradoxus]|uniref:WD40/YVTN/BNR-like repeat-containing protein n=1 Tax=Variovorax paradoxus TaxID=34073 RepID=UPI003D662E13
MRAIFLISALACIAWLSWKEVLRFGEADIFNPRWEIVTTFPERHEVLALWGEGDEILAMGGYLSADKQFEPDFYKREKARRAFILRSQGNSEEWRKVYSGRGELLSVSSPVKKTIYALGVSSDGEAHQKSFIVRSADGGHTWVKLLDPPTGTIGLAFHGAQAGYSWSRDQIFHTADGGQSWQSTFSALELGDGLPPPVADKNGRLWAVGATALHAFEGRLRIRVLPLKPGFRPELLSLDACGTPWLFGRSLAEDGERGPLELLALTDRAAALQQVGAIARPRLLPVHSHVSSGEIFLIASHPEETPPTTYLYTSRDRGKNWRRESPALTRGVRAPIFLKDGTLLTMTSIRRLQRRRPQARGTEPVQAETCL